MIDDRTTHLDLPLPHADNRMRGEDLPRLRQALESVDGELHQLGEGLANHDHHGAYAAVGHDHAGLYAPLGGRHPLASLALADEGGFLELLDMSGYEE